MTQVYLKEELQPSRYVKSFHHRDVHYVVIVTPDIFVSDRRRIVNINDLEQESRDLILKPLKEKQLSDYL